MIDEIIVDSEKLHERADEIYPWKSGESSKELQDIIVRLKKLIRENNLKSLSAPQIGINKRIFVLNFDGDLKSFINPIIIKQEDLNIARDVCSSIPNKTFLFPRWAKISVEHFTPLGEEKRETFIGLAAYNFQHALHHLDGMLLSDIGLEIDSDFEEAEDSEKEEIIRMYCEFLPS